MKITKAVRKLAIYRLIDLATQTKKNIVLWFLEIKNWNLKLEQAILGF